MADDNDKTEEISERIADDGALGGTTDGSDDTVLTLDGSEDESESDDE